MNCSFYKFSLAPGVLPTKLYYKPTVMSDCN